MGITGKQVKDDSLTGADIDESTLVISLNDVLSNGASSTITMNTGSIVPSANETYGLGSPSSHWLSSYVKNLIVSNQLTLSSSTAGQELIRLQKNDSDTRYMVFESEGVDKFEMYLNNFENFVFTTTDTTDDIVFRLNGHSAIYMDGYPKEVRVWDVYNDAYNTKINSTVSIAGEVELNRLTNRSSSLLSNASGTTTHNTADGSVFFHESLGGDFNADFTNVNIAAGSLSELTLILEQGSSARMCTGVKINGSGQTVLWEGGSQPSGTANGFDLITFKIVYDGTNYLVLGKSESYS